MDVHDELAKRIEERKETMPKRYREMQIGIEQAKLQERTNIVWKTDVEKMIRKKDVSLIIPFQTEKGLRVERLKKDLLDEKAKTEEIDKRGEYKYPNLPCWTPGSHVSVVDGEIYLKYLAWDVCCGCDSVVKICLCYLYPEELLGMMSRCEGELEEYVFIIK